MWPATLGHRASDESFGDGMEASLRLNGRELVQTHPIIFTVTEQAMSSWRGAVLVATKSDRVVSQPEVLFILRIMTPDSRRRHRICEVQSVETQRIKSD